MVSEELVYASTSSDTSMALKVSITSTMPSESSYPTMTATSATKVYVRILEDKTKASSSHTAGSTGTLTVY